MSDHNVFKLAQPDSFTDSLTDILREGARALLAQAIEAEVAISSPSTPRSKPRTDFSASCATGICRSGRC